MNGIAGISFQETTGGLVVHVKKKPGSPSGKWKNRLPYNFKQMSKQIMQVKTSDAARPLVAKMQVKLLWLYKKLRSGEYGEGEVAAAILHAAAMERIAKRKVRHLEEEEAAENGLSQIPFPDEEEEIFGKDELQESMKENEEISDDMRKQMMDEIEELEKELAEDMMSELSDVLGCAGGEMSEEKLGEMKRKHREREERQLMRADLAYLKKLFDRLEQEKRQNNGGGVHTGTDDGNSCSYTVCCQPEVELTDMDIGESVDMSI